MIATSWSGIEKMESCTFRIQSDELPVVNIFSRMSFRTDSGAMRARDSTRQAVRTAWGDRWPAATAVGSGDSLKSAGADAGAGRVGARHDETWKS